MGFALVIFVLGFPLSSKEIIQNREVALSLWKKEGATLESIPGKKSVLQPIENTPNSGFLFLDFEPEESFSQSLKVLSNSYIPDSKNSIFGKRSGFFSGKRNQIQVSLEGSKLSPMVREVFSIRMPVLLNEQGSASTLFEKLVLIKGKLFGIVLELEENKPVVTIHNLFRYNDGTTKSTELVSDEVVPRKKWHSITVTVDPILKKISLFQNGKLKVETHMDPEELAGIRFPEEDTTPLVLAKNFYGNIDAIHIHKGYPLLESNYTRYSKAELDQQTMIPSQSGSTLTSPIFASHYSQATLNKWMLGIENPTGSQLNIYFRGSNEKFLDSSRNAPEWQRLTEKPPEIRFKYHQWKIWLRPDSLGERVPLLHSFQYQLKEQLPPSVPTGIRIESEDLPEKKICLLWASNHEREVQNGGGYMIHYGINPDQMDGTIFFRPDAEPASITGKEEGKDFRNLKFCMTENTLHQQFYLPEEKESFAKASWSEEVFRSKREKNGLGFHSGMTYFFRISAYNKFFDEWRGRDQRSGLTEPVSATFSKDLSQR